MEDQLKPAASLSARLLARKGEAAPAESKYTKGIRAEAGHLPRPSSLGAISRENVKLHPSTDGSAESQAAPAKRPIGAGDRIAMTLRLSHGEHTQLKILAAKLKRSSQEIMLDALHEFMSGQDGGDS